MIVDLYVAVPKGEELDPILGSCIEAGLDGVCLLGIGEPPPIKTAQESRFGARLKLFFGVLFQVDRGGLVWIPRDTEIFDNWSIKPPKTTNDVLEITPDAATIAVHPYDRSRGISFGDTIFQTIGLTGIQVANAKQDRLRNNMAIDASTRIKVAPVGGTGMEKPERIGRAATVCLEDVEDQASLIDSLLRGDTWAVEFLGSLQDESDYRDERYKGPRRSGRGRPPRPQGGYRR